MVVELTFAAGVQVHPVGHTYVCVEIIGGGVHIQPLGHANEVCEPVDVEEDEVDEQPYRLLSSARVETPTYPVPYDRPFGVKI